MKKRDLSKYYPPGFDYERWNTFAVLALVILLLAVLITYSSKYSYAYSLLYKDWHHMIIDESRTMQTFGSILAGTFSAFWIFTACCALWAVMMRAYFSMRSNSIYIVKRLKSSRELVVRCIAAPAAFLIAAFVLCVIMILLMRLHYQLAVPKICMPAGNSFGLADLFRAFVP